VDRKNIMVADLKIEIGIMIFIIEGITGSAKGDNRSQFRAAPLEMAPRVSAAIGVFRSFLLSRVWERGNDKGAPKAV
jgi:hypothetical protein